MDMLYVLSVYVRVKDFFGDVNFVKNADKEILMPKKLYQIHFPHKNFGFGPSFIKNRDLCERRNVQIG
jgi:hypothetical protein